ncbi:hypothetical protein ABVT39_020346, partial [Epinephelus coioides]
MPLSEQLRKASVSCTLSDMVELTFVRAMSYTMLRSVCPSVSGENSTSLVIDTDVDVEESSDESSFESTSESPSSEFSELLTPGQRVSSTPLQPPPAETLPAVSNSGSFSTTLDFPDPTSERDAPYQVVKRKKKSQSSKSK